MGRDILRLFVAAALVAVTTPAAAQMLFGKNKVV